MDYASERRALTSRAEPIIEELDDLISVDSPSEGQLTRMDELSRALEKVNVEIKVLDAAHETGLEQLRKIVRDPSKRAAGWIGSGTAGDSPRNESTVQFMRRVKAWDGPVDAQSTKPDLEARALSVLDSYVSYDDGPRYDVEKVERLVRHDQGRADAEYVVVASNPHYRSAFRKMLRDPQLGHLGLEPEEARAFAAAHNCEVRTAMSTTSANGGFLIPFALDPAILLTNASVTNPFRQLAKVVALSNSNVWHGVSSAGVTAEWVAEAGEATDASPSFSQPTITPIRADAYVQASYEVVEDSNIDAQLGMLFADAKDRIEGTAFATGTGSTQPTGVVTALQGVTASRITAQTNGQFGPIDLFHMSEQLPARAQANATWIAHRFVYNLVRQMPGTNMVPFWVDMAGGTPGLLLGMNAYESSAILNAAGTTGLSAATSSNDDVLLCGDWAQSFAIVDRIGGLLLTDPMVKGTNNRPTGQYGFFYFWRVGSGLLDGGNSARILRI